MKGKGKERKPIVENAFEEVIIVKSEAEF